MNDDRHPLGHDAVTPPSPAEVQAALATFFRAADAEILPASVYADLGRLRIAVTLATFERPEPCALGRP